jgi:hypothetical protein
MPAELCQVEGRQRLPRVQVRFQVRRERERSQRRVREVLA